MKMRPAFKRLILLALAVTAPVAARDTLHVGDVSAARGARATGFLRVGEVRAPFGGVMLYAVATPPITKVEPVGFVGHVQADTK